MSSPHRHRRPGATSGQTPDNGNLITGQPQRKGSSRRRGDLGSIAQAWSEEAAIQRRRESAYLMDDGPLGKIGQTPAGWKADNYEARYRDSMASMSSPQDYMAAQSPQVRRPSNRDSVVSMPGSAEPVSAQVYRNRRLRKRDSMISIISSSPRDSRVPGVPPSRPGLSRESSLLSRPGSRLSVVSAGSGRMVFKAGMLVNKFTKIKQEKFAYTETQQQELEDQQTSLMRNKEKLDAKHRSLLVKLQELKKQITEAQDSNDYTAAALAATLNQAMSILEPLTRKVGGDYDKFNTNMMKLKRMTYEQEYCKEKIGKLAAQVENVKIVEKNIVTAAAIMSGMDLFEDDEYEEYEEKEDNERINKKKEKEKEGKKQQKTGQPASAGAMTPLQGRFPLGEATDKGEKPRPNPSMQEEAENAEQQKGHDEEDMEEGAPDWFGMFATGFLPGSAFEREDEEGLEQYRRHMLRRSDSTRSSRSKTESRAEKKARLKSNLDRRRSASPAFQGGQSLSQQSVGFSSLGSKNACSFDAGSTGINGYSAAAGSERSSAPGLSEQEAMSSAAGGIGWGYFGPGSGQRPGAYAQSLTSDVELTFEDSGDDDKRRSIEPAAIEYAVPKSQPSSAGFASATGQSSQGSAGNHGDHWASARIGSAGDEMSFPRAPDPVYGAGSVASLAVLDSQFEAWLSEIVDGEDDGTLDDDASTGLDNGTTLLEEIIDDDWDDDTGVGPVATAAQPSSVEETEVLVPQPDTGGTRATSPAASDGLSRQPSTIGEPTQADDILSPTKPIVPPVVESGIGLTSLLMSQIRPWWDLIHCLWVVTIVTPFCANAALALETRALVRWYLLGRESRWMAPMPPATKLSLRSMVVVLVHCFLALTVQTWVATTRERQIWERANGETREYLISRVYEDPSIALLPGVDPNLMIGGPAAAAVVMGAVHFFEDVMLPKTGEFYVDYMAAVLPIFYFV